MEPDSKIVLTPYNRDEFIMSYIEDAKSQSGKDTLREEIYEILKQDQLYLNSSIHSCHEDLQVQHLLNLYIQWKHVHQLKQSDSKFEHYVVYNLVKLCFRSQTRNSKLVSEILLCIFNCKKDPDGIFHNPFNYRPGWLPFWEWNKNITRSEIDILEYKTVFYFLYHANKTRLTFDGSRFVDLGIFRPAGIPPARSAALNGQPKLLLLLLRYGALQSPEEHENKDWYVPILHQLLLRIFWLIPRNGEETSEALFPVIKAKLWTEISIICVKIILRIIPQLQPHLLKFKCTTFTSTPENPETTDLLEQLGKIYKLHFLKERHINPSALQHLCRNTIRRELWKKWLLPDGINDLPLPQRLKSYIDLDED